MKDKNIHNEQIMPTKDYDRMIAYVDKYFTSLEIPDPIDPVSTNLGNKKALCYPFSQIWKELQQNKRYPKNLFLFLMRLFLQLPNEQEYGADCNFQRIPFVKTFGTEPPNYNRLTIKKS